MLSKGLVRALASRGHDVAWATLDCHSAIDEVVLARATAEGRIVITEDRDFSALVFRDGHDAVGIVVVHSSQYPNGLAASLEEIAPQIDGVRGSLVGFLTTIVPGRVRQRPLSAKP